MSKPSPLKPRRASRTATKTDGKAKTQRKPKEVTDGKLVPSDRKPELRLDLFHIPVSRIKSEASYLVLMKGQRQWQMAKLEGRAWWVGDNLLGRLCDSALIVPTPNRVLHAIDDLADRFSSSLDDYGSVGSKQYYIDRDVIDYGNWLICILAVTSLVRSSSSPSSATCGLKRQPCWRTLWGSMRSSSTIAS